MIHEKDSDGKSALHEAVVQDNYLIVQILLANGGDINIKDSMGQSLLHESTKWCQPVNSMILHKLGSYIDSVDNILRTPLHVCSNKSMPHALMGMEFCVANGANVN